MVVSFSYITGFNIPSLWYPSIIMFFILTFFPIIAYVHAEVFATLKWPANTLGQPHIKKVH